MARHQYLERLSEVPLFSGCSDKELRQIENHSTEMRFPAGRTLTKAGHLGREAFVLIEGTALVRRNDLAVAALGPGSLVGEIALLHPRLRTRTATVEAVTDLRALVFTPGELMALAHVPTIAMKVWAQLAVEVGQLDAVAYG